MLFEEDIKHDIVSVRAVSIARPGVFVGIRLVVAVAVVFIPAATTTVDPTGSFIFLR